MAEMAGLHETLQLACDQHSDRTAVVEADARITYAQLATRIATRAQALDALLGPDRVRVAVQAANSVDYLVTYYALVAAGRLPFLVDAQFGAGEAASIWSSCGVDSWLVDEPGRFALPGAKRPLPDSRLTLVALDPALPDVPTPHPDTVTCRFTSGSTGAPKCLEFSAGAVTAAARNWARGTGLEPADRVMCLASFSNGLAFNTSLLPVFLVGAQLHLYRGLPTSHGITQAVSRSGATRLVAFPFAYRVLAEAPQADTAAFAAVGTAVSAAAVLAPEVRAEFETRYRTRIADYYGIAEVGPCTFERDPRHRDGLGTALPGVAMRVAETPSGEQEIRVRTGSMATRYLNAPDALAGRLDDDGYLRTGDCGRIVDGRLYLTGRLGGPINLAGRKVDPSEVERVVRDLDGVQDAVVFVDSAGDDPVLHVVVAGPECPTRAEVIQACRRNLAPYKVPGRVSRVPSVPRSSTGKVRLSELRRLVTSPEDRTQQDGSE